MRSLQDAGLLVREPILVGLRDRLWQERRIDFPLWRMAFFRPGAGGRGRGPGQKSKWIGLETAFESKWFGLETVFESKWFGL